jgi:hypothetical protein
MISNRAVKPKKTPRLSVKIRDSAFEAYGAILSRRYHIKGGFKRVYHYHIRKTAGASLNYAFWGLGGEDPKYVQRMLRRQNGWCNSNGIVFAGSRIKKINRGHYFYARSHFPAHIIDLPPNTFSVTLFRDPLERVISHYKMLLEFRENKAGYHPFQEFLEEVSWLGEDFENFLDNMPREHLLHQLYMFSADLNPDKALGNILSHCNYYFFTEDFSRGLAKLGDMLGLSLKEYHKHRSTIQVEIPSSTKERLIDMLKDEYCLIAMLKARSNTGD